MASTIPGFGYDILIEDGEANERAGEELRWTSFRNPARDESKGSDASYKQQFDIFVTWHFFQALSMMYL